MSITPIQRQALRLFAELLEYPSADLGVRAGEAVALLNTTCAPAAARLAEFRASVEGLPADRLEEIYTGTFDLDATFHLYAGYYLFGESYKRSAFLLGLKTRYRNIGLEIGSELPDHLSVLLLYAAQSRNDTEIEDVIAEALLPALQQMIGTAEHAEPPDDQEPDRHFGRTVYRALLEALALVLEAIVPDRNKEVAGHRAPESHQSQLIDV